MTNKTEGALSIIAAIIVLFTAMLDPRVSMTISAIALVGLGLYHFTRKSDGHNQ